MCDATSHIFTTWSVSNFSVIMLVLFPLAYEIIVETRHLSDVSDTRVHQCDPIWFRGQRIATYNTNRNRSAQIPYNNIPSDVNLHFR